MQATPDVFDFSQLSSDEIATLLQRFSLRLTVDEALTIQGSEHCSYKSSRKHLNQFNTSAPHVILGPKEDTGQAVLPRKSRGND